MRQPVEDGLIDEAHGNSLKVVTIVLNNTTELHFFFLIISTHPTDW